MDKYAIGSNTSTIEVEEIKIRFPYNEHKEVYIRRKKQMGAIPGQNPDEAKSKIGSSYSGSAPLRGLTFDEEKRHLPAIISINSDSQNWEKAVKDYWASITKDIPSGDGLKLEIGLRYEKKEDYEVDRKNNERDTNGVLINPKGNPINLADYILWRYCLLYSHVANNIEDLGKSPKIRFYIFNKDKEIAIKKVSQNTKRQALQEWFKRMNERDWVNDVLHVLVANDKSGKHNIVKLTSMGEDEKDILMDELIDQSPDFFLKIAKDSNLELKAFIENCVVRGILNRIANTSTLQYEGNNIGSSIDQTIAYLQDKNNNQILNELKAKLKRLP